MAGATAEPDRLVPLAPVPRGTAGGDDAHIGDRHPRRRLVHLATDQLPEFIGSSRGDAEAVGGLLFEAGKAVPKLDGVAAAATRLLELAAEVGEDDWNVGNLVHWGHIIRGHVRLREDDLPGAEAELITAGQSPGSPQLDSFGPDLCLVWMLLKRARS